MYKKFLVPVGVAVAALISSQSHAALTSAEPKIPLELGNLAEGVEGVKESKVTVLQKLIYQLKEERHALLLLKPGSGIIYAQHGSHASHASHRSHRSGY